MKPRLPPELEVIFPKEVIQRIYTFVPHFKKRKTEHILTRSPNGLKDLRIAQQKFISSYNVNFMFELEDFLLDLDILR